MINTNVQFNSSHITKNIVNGAKLISDICDSQIRNDMLISQINNLIEKNKMVIFFGARKNQMEYIATNIKNNDNDKLCLFYSKDISTLPKLSYTPEIEIVIIFGSPPLIKTLKYIKNIFNIKQKLSVVDFVDDNFHLQYHSILRQDIYANLINFHL